MKPIWIRNAAQLVTIQGFSHRPAIGKEMSDLQVISNGSLWIEDGKIKCLGSDEEVFRKYRHQAQDAQVIDATGKLVTPGLVDPHTHLIFAGSREDEFALRLEGKTYMEIMNAGGGIHRTTTATQGASSEELFTEAYERLTTFLRYGVTTVEAKSGYGLSLEHEFKQLKVAKRLNREHPVDVVSTFMGAHAIPPKFRLQPEKYVDQVIREMIPEIADKKLAEFNDVFCEYGVFTPEQSEKILQAGLSYGLLPKIHADEIESYGGAELAAKVGAVSADHLLKASDEGIAAMAERGVVAVLLPGTAFFLRTPAADARKMIDRGVAVAIATDRNPGSSPTESMPLIMNLACLLMGMTPAEVLVAATINAAHAIKRADQIGSLEEGKWGDVVIWDAPNYLYLQYHYGVNLVDTVIKKGQVVISGGEVHDLSVPAS